MANILVIGNGFDLEHGIPSSYKNFLNFTGLIDIYKEFLENDNDFYKQQLLNLYVRLRKISDNYIDIRGLDNDYLACIEEFSQLTNHNLWIDYFQSCLNKRETLGKEFNWIDIEKEISDVIKIISANISLDNEIISKKIQTQKRFQKDKIRFPIGQVIDEIKKNYESNDVRQDMPNRNESWSIYKKVLYDDFLACIRALEIYFDKLIDYNKIEPRLDLRNLYLDKVISFNYTNTLKRCYRNLGDISIEYIHGFANYNRDKMDNNMVLGIEEFLDETAVNKDIELLVYRKFYQRIVKKCDYEYRKFIHNSRKKVVTFFFGHSMAASDKDVLLQLLPNDKSLRRGVSESYVFYHSQQSFSQQVMNLVEILGQDRLNELVCDDKLHFVEQSKLNTLKLFNENGEF